MNNSRAALRIAGWQSLLPLAIAATMFPAGVAEATPSYCVRPVHVVAANDAADLARKLDSLGNLPTTAGQPPCITVLGQRIAALSPAEAAPLNVLYGQLLAAIAAGHRLQARQIARQIGTQSEAQFDGSYLTVRFHAVSHTVDACLDVPPLAAP